MSPFNLSSICFLFERSANKPNINAKKFFKKYNKLKNTLEIVSVQKQETLKELSTRLQANVKDTIKKSLDLDVTEVNIRIKNIAVKKEPNIKE